MSHRKSYAARVMDAEKRKTIKGSDEFHGFSDLRPTTLRRGTNHSQKLRRYGEEERA